MFKHRIFCCITIIFTIVVSGCRSVDSLRSDECIFCIINNLRVPMISVPTGESLSNAIGCVINVIATKGAERVDVIISRTEDGFEPKVEGFSATNIALKDVLQLICESCDYCYVINSDGTLCFLPKYTESLIPTIRECESD